MPSWVEPGSLAKCELSPKARADTRVVSEEVQWAGKVRVISKELFDVLSFKESVRSQSVMFPKSMIAYKMKNSVCHTRSSHKVAQAMNFEAITLNCR